MLIQLLMGLLAVNLPNVPFSQYSDDLDVVCSESIALFRGGQADWIGYPDIIVAPKGRVFVTWSYKDKKKSQPAEIMYTFFENGVWSKPGQLSQNGSLFLSPYEDAAYPAVAILPDNSVAVFWVRGDHLVYREFDWQSLGPQKSLKQYSAVISPIKVLRDRHGNIEVYYTEFVKGFFPDTGHWRIVAAKRTAQRWEPPVACVDYPQTPESFQAIYDSVGNTHLVWINRVNHEGTVMHKKREVNSAKWSQPTEIGSVKFAAPKLDIASGPSGSLHLIWDEEDEQVFDKKFILYSSWKGDRWQRPITMGEVSSGGARPGIEVLKNSKIFVCWNENRHIVYRILDIEGKEILAGKTDSPMYCEIEKVVADENGNIHILGTTWEAVYYKKLELKQK